MEVEAKMDNKEVKTDNKVDRMAMVLFLNNSNLLEKCLMK